MDPKDPSKVKYQASSPDELALVEGAAAMGFKFISRSSNTFQVKLFDHEVLEWETLCEFPFDSTRKRMSLIVRPPHGKFCYLMTKGADSIVIPRLKVSPQVLTTMNSHLSKFAVDGLRTLVLGQKVVQDQDVNAFIAKLEKVKTSNDKNKEQILNDMYDSWEQDLDYLGCTAIEDKLQDGVPETINTLMNADIRIWVLTGDKQETAIEIGKSCKLLMPGMDLCILSSKTKEEYFSKLDRACAEFVMIKLFSE